jgi:hypothetical protein
MKEYEVDDFALMHWNILIHSPQQAPFEKSLFGKKRVDYPCVLSMASRGSCPGGGRRPARSLENP